MADDVERAVAARRDDLQRLAGLQRLREVAHLAVLAHGERRAREPSPDRRGRIGAGGAVGELELCSVGEGDVHVPHASREHAARGGPVVGAKSMFAIAAIGLSRFEPLGDGGALDIPKTKEY